MRTFLLLGIIGLSQAATKGLCYYARLDNAYKIRSLIEAGHDPNEADEDENLPLEVACKFYAFDAAEVLLEHGANPNVYCSQSSIGWFELAIIRGLNGLVDIFHLYGADPDLPDKKTGQSAIQRAITGGNDHLALLMLKYGANPFQIDNEGRSLLLLAAVSGTRRIAIRLLGLGLQPDLECMHLAELYYNYELMEIFSCYLAHMSLSESALDENSFFHSNNFNSDCRHTIQEILGDITRHLLP